MIMVIVHCFFLGGFLWKRKPRGFSMSFPEASHNLFHRSGRILFEYATWHYLTGVLEHVPISRGFHSHGATPLNGCLVISGQSNENGWFRGTPISGNIHMFPLWLVGTCMEKTARFHQRSGLRSWSCESMEHLNLLKYHEFHNDIYIS